MTKFLILDSETSGLFDFKLPADADGQPRLAELSVITCDDEDPGVYIATHFYVKPDGWTLSPEMEAINGLTQALLDAEGVPVAEVLQFYVDRIDEGYVIAAYNAQYDTKVMRGELRRAGIPDRFETTPNICLMRASGTLGVQKADGKKGWPKLSDTYRHITGTELVGPHRAATDTEAARVVFEHLVKVNALPEPAVHYAKNPPQKAAE